MLPRPPRLTNDPENDPADWIGTYGNVALTGQEARFRHYAAQLGKWYSVSAYSPLKGYFVAIFEDITESKKAEEDLLEANRDAEKSHARYEQVVSMISDMVWRHDVDAQGQYVASYISPVADRILGLPNGTIGNNFEKFFSYIHPGDLQAVQESLSEEMRTLGRDITMNFV